MKIEAKLLAIIIALSCVVFFSESIFLKQRIAWEGWGPQDFVYTSLYPERFEKNWQTGIAQEKFLFPRYFFLLAQQYLGIDPDVLVYPYLGLQILLFFCAVAAVTQALFKEGNITIWCLFVVAASRLPGVNMANLGSGYGYVLNTHVWGYANACGFFATAAVLKDRFWRFAVWILLGIYCHLTTGVFFLLFLFFGRSATGLVSDNRDFYKAVGMVAVLTVPLVCWIAMDSKTLQSGHMHPADWFTLTKIFSFHAYPATMRSFTVRAHRELLPLLSLALLAPWMLLRTHRISSAHKRLMVAGSIAALALTMFGILVAENGFSTLVARLNLPRISGLFSFFFALVYVAFLYDRINSGRSGQIVAGCVCLWALMLGSVGISAVFLPLLLICDYPSNDPEQGGRLLTWHRILLLSGLALAAASIAQVIVYRSSNFFELLFAGPLSNDVLRVWAMIGLCLASIVIARIAPGSKRFTCREVLAAGLLFFAPLWARGEILHQEWQANPVRAAYLDVQKWARNNSDPSALFMPEPFRAYGWRDFSQRSSFGNFMEWGFNAIYYEPNLERYQQAVERFGLFGVDLAAVDQGDIESRPLGYSTLGQLLSRKLKTAYYRLPEETYIALSKRYHIDYMVMQKKLQELEFANLPVAYDNRFFIVYQFRNAA